MRHYSAQSVSAVEEREIAQVLAIKGEQIECIEPWLTATKQQVLELRISFSVQANYLAIEHCALCTTLQRESTVQCWEGFELIPVAGSQPATIVFDIRERAITVPLDLE